LSQWTVTSSVSLWSYHCLHKWRLLYPSHFEVLILEWCTLDRDILPFLCCIYLRWIIKPSIQNVLKLILTTTTNKIFGKGKAFPELKLRSMAYRKFLVQNLNTITVQNLHLLHNVKTGFHFQILIRIIKLNLNFY
jgi:hypothetical protein